MFSVIFEVHPSPDQWDAYLLRQNAQARVGKIDGFVDNIRYRSPHPTTAGFYRHQAGAMRSPGALANPCETSWRAGKGPWRRYCLTITCELARSRKTRACRKAT